MEVTSIGISATLTIFSPEVDEVRSISATVIKSGKLSADHLSNVGQMVVDCLPHLANVDDLAKSEVGEQAEDWVGLPPPAEERALI